MGITIERMTELQPNNGSNIEMKMVKEKNLTKRKEKFESLEE